MTPIPKRDYTAYYNERLKHIEERYSRCKKVDVVPVLALQLVFKNFLEQRNCKSLLEIFNRHSRVDAFLTSGHTSIPLEYKSRPCSITNYPSGMLEKEKYEWIVTACTLIDSKIGLYIMHFQDCIAIWHITKDQELKWEKRLCRRNNESHDYVLKDVAYLDYLKADYIISTSSWTQRTANELSNYIKYIRRKYYGD